MDHPSHLDNDMPAVCPKTGRPLRRSKNRWARWLLPVTGFAALVWFLIRVIPKPSRATYPCQRAAQPLACGFVVWVLGMLGSIAAYRRAREMVRRSRYVVAGLSIAVAVLAIFWPLSLAGHRASNAADFVPIDAPNTPLGIGKGIHPGRVVWVYDPALNDAQGSQGNWWEDRRTDPNVAHSMMARAIRNLTGAADEAAAWDAIFRHFNRTHHDEDVGYQDGDKIAIKVNNIFSRSYEWSSSQTNRPSPQMLFALLWQLVVVAGVPDADITIYDCIFYHGDPVYDYCHAAFPGVRWAQGDATDRGGYGGGPGRNPGERFTVTPDPNAVVYYGDPNLIPESGQVLLPTVVSEAKYLINIALPRPHELAGVTLCAKNHFGSVWQPNYGQYHGWDPSFQHAAVAAYDFSGGIKARPYGSYNALVDLMGDRDLGGKTLLFLAECLRAHFWREAPFYGGYASSLFVSQDNVAIDSVLVDFLRSEGDVPDGSVDNYLHEAALADDPPSGTVYDPEGDGTPLESIGVHEHWNNATEKLYSRNLGADEGIELIQSLVLDVTPGDFEPDGDVDRDDLAVLATHWLGDYDPAHTGDLDGDGLVNLTDFATLAQHWSRR